MGMAMGIASYAITARCGARDGEKTGLQAGKTATHTGRCPVKRSYEN